MVKWLGFTLAAILISLVSYLNSRPATNSLISQPLPEEVIVVSPEPVDYTAEFAIYTHGTLRVFTAGMYHNLSEDVFIAADNPNLVRVKKKGVTWKQFFDTLPFELNKDCLVTGTGQTFCNGEDGNLIFSLNSEDDPDALDKVIQPGDELMVSFGP